MRHQHSLDGQGQESNENAGYRGSRWQPNKPRPPQFCRGVSCICTVSAGPPELLGRKALTVIGIPSFCDTASATRPSRSWFVQSTQPNLVMVSPALRPASSAGLPATTLLTFANGASKAAGGALCPACARLAAAESFCACSANLAWCSWRPFSMRDMRSL